MARSQGDGPSMPVDQEIRGNLHLVDHGGTGAYGNLTVDGTVMAVRGIVSLPPTGDTSGAADYAALRKAVSAGLRVVLAQGTYYMNASLTLPAGTVIDGYGATISLTSGATGTEVFRIAATRPAGQVSGITLRGFTVDGTSYPGSSAGIRLKGPVRLIRIVDVTIQNFKAGGGISCSQDTNFTNQQQWPHDLYLSGCRILSCGNFGYNFQGSQNVIAVGCLADTCGANTPAGLSNPNSGFFLSQGNGSRLIGCQSRASGFAGYNVQDTNAAPGLKTAGGVVLSGCYASGNAGPGFDISCVNDTFAAGPVTLDGCVSENDGQDGSHPGIQVKGNGWNICPPAFINGCQVLPGSTKPATALKLSSYTFVSVTGGMFWGTITSLSDDASGTLSYRNLAQRTGAYTSPGPIRVKASTA